MCDTTAYNAPQRISDARVVSTPAPLLHTLNFEYIILILEVSRVSYRTNIELSTFSAIAKTQSRFIFEVFATQGYETLLKTTKFL